MNLLKYKEYFNISGVYKITNLINNKSYIGSSVNLYNRVISHNSELISNSHGNSYLQNSWNKYGRNNFKFEILELSNRTIVRLREAYYINKFNPIFNLAQVDINAKVTVSEETKKKIGVGSSEKYNKNPELRIKASIKAKNTIAGWNKGKVGIYTKEQRDILSLKAKQRWNTPSEADKKNLDKLIIAGNKYREEHKKPIIQYDLDMNFVKEWNSGTQIKEEFNLKSSGNFVTACKKGIKLYNSYWRYKIIS